MKKPAFGPLIVALPNPACRGPATTRPERTTAPDGAATPIACDTPSLSGQSRLDAWELDAHCVRGHSSPDIASHYAATYNSEQTRGRDAYFSPADMLSRMP